MRCAVAAALAMLSGCLDPEPVVLTLGPASCMPDAPAVVAFEPIPVGGHESRELVIIGCAFDHELLDASITTGPFRVDPEFTPPRTLALGEVLRVPITFDATTSGTAQGELVLRFRRGQLAVPLTGAARDCTPTSVITGGDGAIGTFEPVEVDGHESLGACGTSLTGWRWEITPPFGPTVVTHSPVASFEPDLVGPWDVRLEVVDRLGRTDTSEATIEVGPVRRYHVELTWAPPLFAQGGESDLDLHVLHPFAVGEDIDHDGTADGWFDLPFDVHWNNAAPAWGFAGGDDDGRLDRDDREGPGPEVVSLEDCGGVDRYRVGVHFFDDHGSGARVARVRVFFERGLVADRSATLAVGDLWEVGTILCDGTFESASGPSGERVWANVEVVAPGTH